MMARSVCTRQAGLWLVAAALALGGCATVPEPATTEASAPLPSPSPVPALPAVTPAATPAVTPAPSPAQAVVPDVLEAHISSLRPRSTLGVQAPIDIWDRIRRGFAMPDLDNALVRDREQWYASRPDYILRMTERSRRYLFHIVEEIERRNMPTELALLPFIESAFNPQAVSSANAAGMWQFIPSTGKFFDLKQNLFRDERRDVLGSTRAALDYLQKLYDMFGDWHLALAAYNWGEGSVSRAMARNRAQDLPTGYQDLRMPQETRYYVPKLQAVKNIIAHPELFNATLPAISNHPFFKTVAIERDIDVALAARLAEISADDFRALNPSMNKPVILAAGTPQIHLPWNNAEIFERNLQAHEGKRLATWTAWVAPKTMKIDEVASSVNMSVSELRSVNNVPQRMLVQAGSTLLVHRKGRLDNDVTEHLADNAKLSLTPEIVIKRVHVSARKGDTLASLAARHGVSAANLAAWNHLPITTRLKPNQSVMLLVPTNATETLARAGTTARKNSASQASRGKPSNARKGKGKG